MRINTSSNEEGVINHSLTLFILPRDTRNKGKIFISNLSIPSEMVVADCEMMEEFERYF